MRRMGFSLIAALALLAATSGIASGAASVTYNLAGIEYAATSVQGSFAGAARSVTRDDYGAWYAVVVHDPLTLGNTPITGGTFAYQGKLRSYVGTINGGTLTPTSAPSCTRATFTATGTFAYAGGTGGFVMNLTHYGFLTRSGCVTYFATVSGSATFN